MKRKSTMVELVELLRQKPQSTLRDEIIKEALAGEFHDYKNDKYSCGKVAAALLLTVAGFHDLATLVKEGEFDEEADEQDKTNMRKNLPKEMWDIFGLKTGMDS